MAHSFHSPNYLSPVSTHAGQGSQPGRGLPGKPASVSDARPTESSLGQGVSPSCYAWLNESNEMGERLPTIPESSENYAGITVSTEMGGRLPTILESSEEMGHGQERESSPGRTMAGLVHCLFWIRAKCRRAFRRPRPQPTSYTQQRPFPRRTRFNDSRRSAFSVNHGVLPSRPGRLTISTMKGGLLPTIAECDEEMDHDQEIKSLPGRKLAASLGQWVSWYCTKGKRALRRPRPQPRPATPS